MDKNLYIFPEWMSGFRQGLSMKLYLQRNSEKEYHTVILRFRYGDEVYNTTLCNIPPEGWDHESRSLRPEAKSEDGKNAMYWNNLLNSIHAELKAYLASLPPASPPSMIKIRNIVKSAMGRPVITPTLSSDYNTYILERNRSRHWHEKTLLRERYVARLFLAFAGKAPAYETFTVEYLKSFAAHLEEAHSMREENLRKAITSVNGFLSWARMHGRPVPDGRFQYKYVRSAPPVVYLTKAELKRIVNYSIPLSGTEVSVRDMHGRPVNKIVVGSEGMSLARDFLVFCCVTGLRYSELQALRPSNVRNENILRFVADKTDTKREVELNRMALEIIKKYASDQRRGNYLFPRLSNQKANARLHDLAELCEINAPVSEMTLINGHKQETLTPKYEHITTHTGRKTFVCLALLSGLSPELITQWTGHASVDDMRPYIAATSEAGADGMRRMYEGVFSEKGGSFR